MTALCYKYQNDLPWLRKPLRRPSMKRFSIYILMLIFLLVSAGCAQNYYNIPRETYEKKVRVIGVAPLFMDADSDIRHPEKDTLVALMTDFNRKNESELVAGLKDTGSYFSVTFLQDEPSKLFSEILFRREKRDDAGIVYNKYFYKGPEIRNLIAKNNVDALMLLVVSGLTARDEVYSSNLLSKLESEYNGLAISGQILDAEGNILWEFPNFRQSRLTYPKFIQLQYPDFDEARANETDKVDVKFKTIPGINRLLGKSSKPQYRINSEVSDAYSAIFDELLSTLRPQSDLFSFGKKTKPAVSPENQPPPANGAPQSYDRQNLQPSKIAAPVNENVSPTGTARQPTPPVAGKAADTFISSPAGSPPAEQVLSPAIAPAN